MTEEFTKKLIGAKVNISANAGRERFVGVITKFIDDTWVELVPFAGAKDLEEEYSDDHPYMTITPIFAPMLKRLSGIDTIIILEKPDRTYYGKTNTKGKKTEQKS